MGVEAADIVLMDLSNINDNIRWGIQQVRDLKKPQGLCGSPRTARGSIAT